MREEKIIITIDEDGKISAKTKGLKGELCLEELEELLAHEPLGKLKTTDEYNQSEENKVKNPIKRKR